LSGNVVQIQLTSHRFKRHCLLTYQYTRAGITINVVALGHQRFKADRHICTPTSCFDITLMMLCNPAVNVSCKR